MLFTTVEDFLTAVSGLGIITDPPSIELQLNSGIYYLKFSNAEKDLTVLLNPAAQNNSFLTKNTTVGEGVTSELVSPLSEENLSNSFNWLLS
jgi:hypothetical protein